jgi:hypothetical protein
MTELEIILVTLTLYEHSGCSEVDKAELRRDSSRLSKVEGGCILNVRCILAGFLTLRIEALQENDVADGTMGYGRRSC